MTRANSNLMRSHTISERTTKSSIEVEIHDTNKSEITWDSGDIINGSNLTDNLIPEQGVIPHCENTETDSDTGSQADLAGPDAHIVGPNKRCAYCNYTYCECYFSDMESQYSAWLNGLDVQIKSLDEQISNKSAIGRHYVSLLTKILSMVRMFLMVLFLQLIIKMLTLTEVLLTYLRVKSRKLE